MLARSYDGRVNHYLLITISIYSQGIEYHPPNLCSLAHRMNLLRTARPFIVFYGYSSPKHSYSCYPHHRFL
ncbi:hypothetical protein [Candidatus Sarmatiella mevalonica]|uniref:hypothetical protein n=1 Tax=Candidatus Sarmatiella mevalonica TaxID=2770581 RepID=UPI001922C07C|nr:hypothetical protein [Candidatus Sarmatiella mevalonica]